MEIIHNEKIYNKRVLKKYTLEIKDVRMMAIVLDDKDYYNIHIMHPSYKTDEMNTLELQEPKADVLFSEIMDKMLMELIIQKFLWHELHGHKGAMWSFTVQAHENEI